MRCRKTIKHTKREHVRRLIDRKTDKIEKKNYFILLTMVTLYDCHVQWHIINLDRKKTNCYP